MKKSIVSVLAIGAATEASQAKTTGTPFGPDASLYNAVTFGDFSCAGNDVQGRLAVGGNAALYNGFTVGCNAPGDSADQCPSFTSWSCKDLGATAGTPNYYGLVVGGALEYTRGQLSGGLAYGSVHPAVNPSTMKDCATMTSTSSSPFNFANSKSYLTALAGRLTASTTTGSVANNGYGTLTLTGSNVAGLEVFQISGAVLSTTNTFNLAGGINSAATIVINVSGSSITLAGGTSGLNAHANRIVWNFYEATSLNINNYAVFGAIVAPSADVKSAGVVWGQLFVNSWTTTSADFWAPGTCAQVNYVPFTGTLPPPPSGNCGDGNVDSGEQCDLGASNGAATTCCSATCTYVSSGTTCRAAAGECDVAETCTGSSSSCPTDAFKPEATACSAPFGICNLELQNHCPGNGAQCIDNAPNALLDWDAFNLISFDSYTCNGGDIEGALAVRNNAQLSSYDVGLKISQSDAYVPYSLAVAGNCSWASGEVHPALNYPWIDRNGMSHPEGFIAVGQNFIAPDYLQASRSNVYLPASKFDDAKVYYQTIQDKLNKIATNAKTSTLPGSGLQVTCDSGATDLVHFAVDGSVLSNTQYYVTSGCKFDAGYIIDVTGNSDVVIKGGKFPGIVEKVVYNVLGSGRTIYGQTGVSGNILAPGNSYTQSEGVTYGRVIVGDVPEARQNNKPNCVDFSQVTITTSNLERVNVGDTWIYVVSVTPFSPGDILVIGGERLPVLSFEDGPAVYIGRKRATTSYKLNLGAAFKSSYPANSMFSTLVDANANRTAIPNVPTPSDAAWSGASALSFGAVGAFVAAVAAFVF